MDKFFKIKERGSTVGIEVLGGVTTFFAMAYIIFVNPNILSTGNPELLSSIFLATCLSAAIGTILTALMANIPFAQAPGMGLNAFFTFTVCFGMGYSFNQALAIVLISGLVFLVVSVTPLRGLIIKSIPACIKAAIGAGIGLFIAFIGFLGNGAGIVKLDEANAITGLNLATETGVNMGALLTIIGLLIISILLACKVKGAIFIGIIATTLIGIPMGVTHVPEQIFTWDITLSGTFMQLEFNGLLSNGLLPLVTAIISFFLVDMFDTIGTLIGTAGNNNMLDEDGNMPGGDKAIIADAIATCAGAVLGTSTVTTFVESSAGVSEGAKTGLASVVTGLMFLVAIILSPLALMIPGAATAPALIIVGVFMLKSATRVVWDDMEQAIPAFITMAMMSFSYSISDGIAFGFVSYVVIKSVRAIILAIKPQKDDGSGDVETATSKIKEIPALMWVITIMFVVMYILNYFI